MLTEKEKYEEEISSISRRNKEEPVGNGYFSEFKDWSKVDQKRYNELLEKVANL